MINLVPVKTIVLTALLLPFSAIGDTDKRSSAVTLPSQIIWGHLNPLRGDKSPAAANLWGDRTSNVATGMLVRFNQGFSSPPHIHNVSYRGIVIDGLLHNDEPIAKKMWMPQGSFWTQPAGGNHITAANGKTNLIYLEIDHGPYLVRPSDKQFDNNQTPINRHSNMIKWQTLTNGVMTSSLWQAKGKQIAGTMIKLAPGFSGELISSAEELKMVVIAGEVKYHSEETPEPMLLVPSSFVSSTGQFKHQITANNGVTLYIRHNGDWKIKPLALNL